MSRPFWVLNLILFILFMGALVFSFYAKIKTPIFKQTRSAHVEHDTIEAKKIDLKEIYQHDLFGTVPRQEEVIAVPQEITAQIPNPPQRIYPRVPTTTSFKFLEPLPITLTGIIYFDDTAKDRAIIVDNRRKRETVYKVDDELEDAQIINIMADKVLLLRSNGQQEIVYLNQENKEKRLNKNNWATIVDHIGNSVYQVNRLEFLKEIPTLSDLIFKFNIKSASKDNKSIGIRIGGLAQNSLALSLGLRSGDLITAINGVAPLSTKSRMTIYNDIINNNTVSIHVELMRNNMKKILVYEIKDYLDKGTKSRYKNSEIKVRFEDKQPQVKQKAHKDYAQVLQEAKAKDKDNIFKFKKK